MRRTNFVSRRPVMLDRAASIADLAYEPRARGGRGRFAVRALFVAAALSAACRDRATAVEPSRSWVTQQVANLHAFARLYGVLRWFHPSDAAAAIDWDGFAVAGVRRLLSVPDAAALHAALAELIAPIAPTVHIVEGRAEFPDEPWLHPPAADALEVVAWQHRGFGDSTIGSLYASKRRHRPRTVSAAGTPFAALWQAVDASALHGATVRLRGRVRVARRGLGQLWMRVDRGDERVFFDNMSERPIAASTWQTAEIIGVVDPHATRIVFGVLLGSSGVAWYDDLELASQAADGSWTAIPIQDAGFEAGDPLVAWKPGVGRPSATSIAGWNVVVDPGDPASGRSSLRIERGSHLEADELFTEAPRPAETADIDLGSGLRARVPLALYAKDGRTLGDDPARALAAQAHEPDVAPASFEPAVAVADVIVAWSALEHFWPYWEVVTASWGAQLDSSLTAALSDRTVEDHVATLARLSAAAPDGHAATRCPGKPPQGQLPVAFALIEGQIVATASADPAVQRGDAILTIDGKPALQQLGAAQALESGSAQWQRVAALSRLGVGPRGSKAALVMRRGHDVRNVVLTRGELEPTEPLRPAIERLDDGVYYVDLTRAAMPDLDAIMDRLAAASGVVFDIRGYPLQTHDLLRHLTGEPLDLVKGCSIPHVIRPDHVPAAITTWEEQPRVLSPLQPRLTGRIAFLAGPHTISYAELLVTAVDHYHLGAIFGSATAGTDGNRADVSLPSQCTASFTGLRCTRGNGERLHLIGIPPTHPIERTLAGFLAGRDEVLEAALQYVRRRTAP